MTAPRAPKPGSRLEIILRALSRRTGLTVADAAALGDFHLCASIFQLKRAGYRVVDRWESGPTRYKTVAKFKRFYVRLSQAK